MADVAESDSKLLRGVIIVAYNYSYYAGCGTFPKFRILVLALSPIYRIKICAYSRRSI